MKRKKGVTGIWFAWYPVRTGALKTGQWVWWRRVWYATALGITIYQKEIPSLRVTKT